MVLPIFLVRRTSKTKPVAPYQKTLIRIGKVLEELREMAGYKTCESFSQQHDLPRVQYWRVEKGRANVTIRTLHRLASLHGITVLELFHRAEQIKDDNE
jgi:transcriptional regulator with XRE-family HTH domain